MNSKTSISIIIPVKNGFKTLPECLNEIRRQTLYPNCEIIIIDSGSTDGSVDYLLSQKDVHLSRISPESFNHGLTRNLGVQMAKGEFVVMTVQDAVAADEKWLEKMLGHFEHPNVAGVCGQQVVPHHLDKNPHQWFRPVSKPGIRKVKFDSAEQYDALSPAEKKRACSWDDVNAMYRRSVLLEIPFQEAFFAEDALWAQDVLRQGYTLVYDTSARVYHYHYQSYDYTYRRMLTQLFYGYQIFQHRRKNNFKYLDYLKVIYRNFKYKAHPKWIWHNWRMMKAKNKAFTDSYKWLNKDSQLLEKKYKEVCQKPPQGASVK